MPPLGRIASPPDDRDYSIRSLVPAIEAIPLPRRYAIRSLSRSYRRRFDQQENSCVGQSTALTKIVHERRDARRHYAIDPLWIWRRSKALDGIGNPNVDRGTFIRTAMGVLLHEGARLATDPEPIDDGLAADARFRIASYFRLTSIDEVKAAVRLFGPVVIGTDWFHSWMSAPGGELDAPDDIAGGHATVVYGWDDRHTSPWGGLGALRVANSWGAGWGDGGDFWLPYGYVPTDSGFEAWKSIDATTGAA